MPHDHAGVGTGEGEYLRDLPIEHRADAGPLLRLDIHPIAVGGNVPLVVPLHTEVPHDGRGTGNRHGQPSLVRREVLGEVERLVRCRTGTRLDPRAGFYSIRGRLLFHTGIRFRELLTLSGTAASLGLPLLTGHLLSDQPLDLRVQLTGLLLLLP